MKNRSIKTATSKRYPEFKNTLKICPLHPRQNVHPDSIWVPTIKNKNISCKYRKLLE